VSAELVKGVAPEIGSRIDAAIKQMSALALTAHRAKCEGVHGGLLVANLGRLAGFDAGGHDEGSNSASLSRVRANRPSSPTVE
jgi:hypothetical protein